MSDRNVIQTTFDEFGKTVGGSQKSGSWYVRSPETIVVLNLQKSNYSVRYFVNVALWLNALGEADAPKENKCPVRTRLNELLPDLLDQRVDELLDLNYAMDDESRREELEILLQAHLLPAVEASSTLAGLGAGAGRHLIERSLVTGPAQRLLGLT
jgi:hypothetical protein